MSGRGINALELADDQIAELVQLLSTRGEDALSLPCRGRQKLGDGTVGATASHMADNYRRIAAFVTATAHGRHRASPGHEPGRHPAADRDRAALLARLREARHALGVLADLSEDQLDQVPPASGMRFVDGQRTLEEIVAALLRHQQHQVDAIAATLGAGRPGTPRESRAA
jgi:hypothetical protein